LSVEVERGARGHAGFRLDGRITPVRRLLRDVFASRGLIAILARQSFFVQYRRATFGLLWSILLPLLQATVLAIVLTRITSLGRGLSGVHFVTFIFAGQAVWIFFSNSMNGGATSIVGGAGLTTKVYFPRAVLPLVSVVQNLFGLVAGTGVLIALCVVTGVPLTLRLLALPVALALALALTASLALVLAAAHVYFRDTRYIVTAAMQPWFYLTPVFYSVDRFESARHVLEANPLTGVVLLIRWACLGPGDRMGLALWWTLAWTVAAIGVALILYRRFERVFADLM